MRGVCKFQNFSRGSCHQTSLKSLCLRNLHNLSFQHYLVPVFEVCTPTKNLCYGPAYILLIRNPYGNKKNAWERLLVCSELMATHSSYLLLGQTVPHDHDLLRAALCVNTELSQPSNTTKRLHVTRDGFN